MLAPLNISRGNIMPRDSDRARGKRRSQRNLQHGMAPASNGVANVAPSDK